MVNIQTPSADDKAALGALMARERDFSVLRAILRRTRESVRESLETTRDREDFLRLQGQAKLLEEIERLFKSVQP